ncbi:uncharacterized protein F5147DRAFT_776289 [Suillus discolor]|uniref:Uncharacterized protein n=1 Tax=Suillus discolor TaxID=1912936 RepID=A0A9P7F2R4_9AGAM|nr:uncharacterized protein F5147DRAFT_776289 [Suillus discolor]KAG2102542.1 hypothetical protein F5147DRAFT_776289 [Suillus discolor]
MISSDTATFTNANEPRAARPIRRHDLPQSPRFKDNVLQPLIILARQRGSFLAFHDLVFLPLLTSPPMPYHSRRFTQLPMTSRSFPGWHSGAALFISFIQPIPVTVIRNSYRSPRSARLLTRRCTTYT